MSISLEKSVRTCDVNTGEANRIQSDRFFNPSNMVCIPWNGLNNKGQEVCPDSFYTKTPGCDSAEDRVMVENSQRPKYFNYVTLGAQGVQGAIYGNVSAQIESDDRTAYLHKKEVNNPRFGVDFGSKVQYQGCSIRAYENAMKEMSQQGRAQTSMNEGYKAANDRRMAGGY